MTHSRVIPLILLLIAAMVGLPAKKTKNVWLYISEIFWISVVYILPDQFGAFNFFSFMTINLVVTFVLFVMDVLLKTRPEMLRFRKVSFMFGYSSENDNYCHNNNSPDLLNMAFGIDNIAYHYLVKAQATRANMSYDFVPQTHKYTVGHFRGICLWFSFIGICEVTPSDIVISKLSSCGKCHDFPIISVYTLAKHKELSYHIMTPLRWELWVISGVCIGLTLFAHVTVTDSLVYSRFVCQSVCDSSMILLSMYDGVNIAAVEKNNAQQHTPSQRTDMLRLIMVSILSALWVWYMPILVTNFGVFVYMIACLMVTFAVHSVVGAAVPIDHAAHALSEF